MYPQSDIGDQGASFRLLLENFSLASGKSGYTGCFFSFGCPIKLRRGFDWVNAGNDPQAVVDLSAEGLIGALAISPDP